MNPKRGVRNVEVDLRIVRDLPDRANRYASEQERCRCLDPMRSIHGRGGKGQRTTLHEVSATTNRDRTLSPVEAFGPKPEHGVRSTRRQRTRCRDDFPSSRRRGADRFAGELFDGDMAGQGADRFAGGPTVRSRGSPGEWGSPNSDPCSSWGLFTESSLGPACPVRVSSFVTGTERGNPRPGR
jgi:hypothetical protein